jgi:hypothetical protein
MPKEFPMKSIVYAVNNYQKKIKECKVYGVDPPNEHHGCVLYFLIGKEKGSFWSREENTFKTKEKAVARINEIKELAKKEELSMARTHLEYAKQDLIVAQKKVTKLTKLICQKNSHSR